MGSALGSRWESSGGGVRAGGCGSGSGGSAFGVAAACDLWLEDQFLAAVHALSPVGLGGGSYAGFNGEGGGGVFGGATTAPGAVAAHHVGVGGFGRKRGRARLRNRNRVIDEGLADEDGHGAYADLEGFIVD